MDNIELKRRQSLSLPEKIELSNKAIKDYYEFLNGRVYISISGGKDSTVLLDLVRHLYPNVKAMFLDTGLEHPENRDFIKSLHNVDWVKPKKNFVQVIDEEGYPIPTKAQAQHILEAQTTNSNYLRRVRLKGKPIGLEKDWKKFHILHPKIKREEHYQLYIAEHPNEPYYFKGRISECWRFLAVPDENGKYPFNVSNKCCDILKKNPAKEYNKKTRLFPITGEMAVDSVHRKDEYLKHGCNALSSGKIKSTPLGFWTEKDIWEYIHRFNLSYSDAYKHGLERTGCMFCLFGIAEEKVSRFTIMKQYHPQLYDYCMNKLGIKQVFDILEQNNVKLKYPYPQPH
jgi:3'-phosphoadenosine 5'-phosphosulfate sulfotransferase (PAPS reductase)/FAD synthetase